MSIREDGGGERAYFAEIGAGARYPSVRPRNGRAWVRSRTSSAPSDAVFDLNVEVSTARPARWFLPAPANLHDPCQGFKRSPPRITDERGAWQRKFSSGVVLRIIVVWILCLLASHAMADDAAHANRLMVDAVKFIQASELEPSAVGKFALLKRAHDNLVEIVERFPSTDLAVKLATGQTVGSISLAGVRQAMNRARVTQPGKPGAPVRAWRHGTGVVAVAMPSSGRLALAVDRGGTAALRDIETGELVRTWRHPDGLSDVHVSRRRWGGASTVALSPRGRRMLTAGRTGTVALREVGTGRVLSEWEHERAVGAVALSRNRRLALVGGGHEALLIDVRELNINRSWRGKSPVTALAYAPDGRWILSGFADGRAVLGEVGTGKTLHTWKHRGSGGGGVMAAVFSPDGGRVLIGAANRTAVLHDVATGKTLRRWRVGERVTSVAYSRDGRWVLTGDEGYEVELHDTRNGRTVRKWRYDASAEAVAFSSNGRQALMGFADGAVILCDILVPERKRGYARTVLTMDGGCW